MEFEDGSGHRTSRPGIRAGQSETSQISVYGKPVAELGQEDAPPKIYRAPQPNLKVAPNPRGESK